MADAPTKSPSPSMKSLFIFLLLQYLGTVIRAQKHDIRGGQPLSKIAIHMAVFALHDNASIKAYPNLLGSKGEDAKWITVELSSPHPSEDDWVGIFSPAKFNSSECPDQEVSSLQPPYIYSAPFKPELVAISNTLSFVNPKAPLYPRLSLGKARNEMAVSWTSGYNVYEATPLVEWGLRGEQQSWSPAGTLTFNRNSMCAPPARTVGWRDPGFIHTSFLKDLWPKALYTYKLGHRLSNNTYLWSKIYSFRSSPYPGQDSLQRVV